MKTRALAATIVVALAIGACSTTPQPAPSQLPSSTVPAMAPLPVIVDADMDISDLFAVAVLLRDPALDVRAIAIDGTGLVHCAGGRRVTRYLLEQLGRMDVPYACGRQDAGPRGRAFPDDWRETADGAYGLDIPAQHETDLPEEATDLLVREIGRSPEPPTIIALGPWTNLADAFAADPALIGRVAGIHAMAGTIDAPGNVFVDGLTDADRLEWNVVADPDSFAAVLALDVPVTLVPLDATDDVPVPPDLLERLEADHRGAGADLAYELLVRYPDRLDLPGGQLWDELAALLVSEPAMATWVEEPVTIGERGRIDRDPAGRLVRYAAAADRPAVEAALLAGLRRGGARPTPFAIAGDLTIRYDGAACRLADEPPTSGGLYRLGLVNGSSDEVFAIVIRLEPPHEWGELLAFLDTIDLATADSQPPDWVVDVGGVDAGGTGMAALAAGTIAVVCMSGEWPDITFTGGTPWTVGP